MKGSEVPTARPPIASVPSLTVVLTVNFSCTWLTLNARARAYVHQVFRTQPPLTHPCLPLFPHLGSFTMVSKSFSRREWTDSKEESERWTDMRTQDLEPLERLTLARKPTPCQYYFSVLVHWLVLLARWLVLVLRLVLMNWLTPSSRLAVPLFRLLIRLLSHSIPSVPLHLRSLTLGHFIPVKISKWTLWTERRSEVSNGTN